MSLRNLILSYTVRQNLFRQIRFVSCWSCGNEVQNMVANLFCGKCNALQHPKEENYFKIMGVNETYNVDENELSKKYKDLQKYLHPDKFGNKDEKEQEISEKYSSLVNEAYKTLLEPLSRGIYMLRLKGKELPENTEVDQGFLMEIMEKNEEVEHADTEEKIMKLNKENKIQIQALQKQLSQAFYDGDLQRVIKILSVMKYYTSIDVQIQASIRSKGIIR